MRVSPFFIPLVPQRGLHLSESDVDAIVRAYDTGKDGTIDYEELVHAVEKAVRR